MFRRRSKDENKRLEMLGREVVRAAAIDVEEPTETAASHYLYSRVRAAVEASEHAGRPPVAPLLDVFATARLTVAAAALSLFATVCFWLIRLHPSSPRLPPSKVDASVGVLPADKLTACSISSKEKCVISTEDVLQLLVSQKLQEQGK
jgi:hypothetical protein